MDELLQTQFFYENGLDMEIVLSKNSTVLLKEENWIKDADATQCMMCSARFTLTFRRHHCRTCGRVFCEECCPDADPRSCILCSMARDLDQRQQSPQLFDISSVLMNGKMIALWDSSDDFLRRELLRVIQNFIRNDSCRKAFKKKFQPTWIQNLIETFTAAIKLESPVFSIIVSIFINFTASTEPEFAQYLDENNVTISLISAIQQPLPLHMQILVLQALRNIFVLQSACEKVGPFKDFYPTMFQILQTGAIRAQEFVVAIFGNLLKQLPNEIDKILPKTAIPGTCRENQLIITCNQLLFEKNASVQIMATRVVSLVFKSAEIGAAAQSEFLSNMVHLLDDDERVATAAAFCLFTCLLELGNSEKMLQRTYAKQLYTTAMVLKLIDKTQQDNAIISRSVVACIHALAEIDCKKLVSIIKDKAVQDNFVTACKALVEHEQFIDVTDHIVETLKILKDSGEDGAAIVTVVGDLGM